MKQVHEGQSPAAPPNANIDRIKQQSSEKQTYADGMVQEKKLKPATLMTLRSLLPAQMAYSNKLTLN